MPSEESFDAIKGCGQLVQGERCTIMKHKQSNYYSEMPYLFQGPARLQYLASFTLNHFTRTDDHAARWYDKKGLIVRSLPLAVKVSLL